MKNTKYKQTDFILTHSIKVFLWENFHYIFGKYRQIYNWDWGQIFAPNWPQKIDCRQNIYIFSIKSYNFKTFIKKFRFRCKLQQPARYTWRKIKMSALSESMWWPTYLPIISDGRTEETAVLNISLISWCCSEDMVWLYNTAPVLLIQPCCVNTGRKAWLDFSVDINLDHVRLVHWKGTLQLKNNTTCSWIMCTFTMPIWICHPCVQLCICIKLSSLDRIILSKWWFKMRKTKQRMNM